MQRRDVLRLSLALLGSAASFSLARALQADTVVNPGMVATVFDPPGQAAIELLSEMIIPETDTPGAIAAGVPDFIAVIVSSWYTPTERKVFFSGLQQLDAYCLQQENQPFHLASEASRVAALTEQERIASEYQPPMQGGSFYRQSSDEEAPFFKKIRELVVLGYYTSEVGCTEELAYRPAPGEYNGDYEFAKIGRQWSH